LCEESIGPWPVATLATKPAYSTPPANSQIDLRPGRISILKREQVKACIEEIGIFPGIRVSSGDEALYCAETIYEAGIPVAEITMTVPGAIDVIRQLAERFPNLVVGAGTVLDKDTADRCLNAGARFITSTGLVMEVIEETLSRGVVAIPGALTPTEIIAAWKSGADFVKVFPAASLGADLYIRSLKLPLPQVQLIAAGGVNPQDGFQVHSCRSSSDRCRHGTLAQRCSA